jgi:hypothetical protein
MSLRSLPVASLLLPLLVACGADPALTGAASESSGDAATSTSTPTPTTSATTAGTATAPTTSTAGSASEGQTTGQTETTAETTNIGTDSSTNALETTSGPDGTTTTTTDTTDTSTGDSSTGATSELTLEHMQVKGTHNSYHLKPLIPFDPSHDYSHVPLDEQLDAQGVRAFELDIHKGFGGLEVYHITVIDAVSTCDTFGGCLGVIKGWSDAHPKHLPITIWIEVKDQTGGSAIGPADLDALDDVVRGVFPEDKLLTPDDIQGAYPSVRDALTGDGWPTIDSVRGQVLFVLLNVEDTHASNYTASYTTLAGRAMFARATPKQFALPWAAIAKLGAGDAADITAAHAAHLLIATNVCGAGESDDACFATLDTARDAGIHMLKDDFPAAVPNKTYWMDFPDGDPARCNPVTAPPDCSSALLEHL